MFLPNTGSKLDRTASQCVFLEITGAFCTVTMTGGMVGGGGLLLASNGKEPWMPAFLHCTGLFCTMMCYHISPFWGNVSLGIHVGENIMI